MIDADLSRTLIIKPSSLGDVVQALPVAWALKELRPQARIDWLATPACAGVVEGLEAVNRVVPFRRQEYGRMWRNPLTLASFGWFLLKLRRAGYTTVLDLQGLFRSAFLCRASGAPRRIGLSDAREGAEQSYTDVVPVPAEPMSSVDRYLLAAEALGAPAGAVRRFDIHLPPEKLAAARALLVARGLAEGQRYVVLVPGGRWATKRWPEERFAALAQRVDEHLGLVPVLAGAAGERQIAERMRRMRGGRMVDLIGRTDLKTLAALLRGAACVVSNDSGPMHLAAALGRPVVALFGPTSPQLTGPYGAGHVVLADRAECARCDDRRCRWEGSARELVCLRNIAVDEVFEAVKGVVGAAAAPGGMATSSWP